VIGCPEHDRGLSVDRRARLGDRVPTDKDIAGQNQRPGALARGNERTLYEQMIKPRFQEAISSSPNLLIPKAPHLLM